LNLDVDLIPLTVPEVRRLLVAFAWSTPPGAERTLGWSIWRRHQARARRGHYKRRLERLRQRHEQVRL